MGTIKLNTYDPAGRFNLDDNEADALFDRVESILTEQGWDVDRICAESDGYAEWSDEYEALRDAYRSEGY